MGGGHIARMGAIECHHMENTEQAGYLNMELNITRQCTTVNHKLGEGKVVPELF
jgi:hypothetical protein